MTAPRCQFVKPDGSTCGAFARSGRAYCIAHDPSADSADARVAAKYKAAKRSATFEPLDIGEPRTTGEIVAALALIAGKVAAGKADPRSAQIAVSALRTQLEALTLDERLREAEKQIAALRKQLGVKNAA